MRNASWEGAVRNALEMVTRFEPCALASSLELPATADVSALIHTSIVPSFVEEVRQRQRVGKDSAWGASLPAHQKCASYGTGLRSKSHHGGERGGHPPPSLSAEEVTSARRRPLMCVRFRLRTCACAQ